MPHKNYLLEKILTESNQQFYDLENGKKLRNWKQ